MIELLLAVIGIAATCAAVLGALYLGFWLDNRKDKR